VGVFLHRRPAPGHGDHDGLHVRGGKGVDYASGSFHGLLFAPGVAAQCTAALLLLRRDDIASLGGKNPSSGGIDVTEEHALHAPR
jgi:hypothetical protein